MIHDRRASPTTPAFQDGGGDPVIDTSELYYDGNSQGGILGGSLVAVAPDLTRGVLGVPGHELLDPAAPQRRLRALRRGPVRRGDRGSRRGRHLRPGGRHPAARPVRGRRGALRRGRRDPARRHPARPLRQLSRRARAPADPLADADALGPRRGERLRPPHDHGPARRTPRRTRSCSTPPSATTRSRTSPPRSRRGRSAPRSTSRPSTRAATGRPTARARSSASPRSAASRSTARPSSTGTAARSASTTRSTPTPTRRHRDAAERQRPAAPRARLRRRPPQLPAQRRQGPRPEGRLPLAGRHGPQPVHDHEQPRRRRCRSRSTPARRSPATRTATPAQRCLPKRHSEALEGFTA